MLVKNKLERNVRSKIRQKTFYVITPNWKMKEGMNL